VTQKHREIGGAPEKALADRKENIMEALLRQEAFSLPDDALLEILLAYALPRSKQVEDMARELLAGFGDIKGVLTASTVELTEIEGLGKKAVSLLRLSGEIAVRYAERLKAMPEMLSNDRDIQRHLLSRFQGAKEEQLLFIFLDRQGLVLGDEIIGAGTVDRVVAFPRQVMEMALRYNASSLIMVHNHPHGPPLPSVQDREEAERLRDILSPFDVVLKDSIVVGHNRCFSIFGNRPL
jgi:DNA repair protein RadC